MVLIIVLRYSAPLRVERFLKSIHRKDIEFTYIHTYIFDEAGQSLANQRAGVDLP